MKLQKFIIALIALAVLLSPTASFAQGWVPFLLDVIDEDLDDYYPLKEPKVIDFYGNVGYALGDDGTMYKSLDNGKSWIGASDDGVGNTWIGLTSQWAIYNLYALAENTVMMISSGRYANKSDNGGLSFYSNYLEYVISTKYSWLMKSAQINNEEYLFIDGDHLYKTNDTFETGYVVYNATELDSNEYLCDMAASDSGKSIILLVCNSDSTLVSDDAGKTFTRKELSFHGISTSTEINFASDKVVYMLSTTGELYKSIDGGFSWGIMPKPNNTLRFADSMDFLDEQNGIAVAYSYGYGQVVFDLQTSERIFFTSNGGYSWTMMNAFIPNEFELSNQSVYYDNADRLFAVGGCDDGTDSKLNGACILRYNPADGVLIKSAESKKVYYSGKDGLLHWIPNESTFYSWYDNFNSVETVPKTYIDSMNIGNEAIPRRSGETKNIGKVMNW